MKIMTIIIKQNLLKRKRKKSGDRTVCVCDVEKVCQVTGKCYTDMFLRKVLLNISFPFLFFLCLCGKVDIFQHDKSDFGVLKRIIQLKKILINAKFFFKKHQISL